MYRVVKKFSFEAGHRLRDYEGVCKRLHGHSYVVELSFASGDLDNVGFVVDFNELKDTVRLWIDRTFDHKFLVRADDPLVLEGDAVGVSADELCIMKENPTAENIAKMIADYVNGWLLERYRSRSFDAPKVLLEAVSVHETATGCAALSW